VQIGCSVSSVTSWERNRAHAKVSELPGIIDFLGYVSIEPGEAWPARLSRARQAVGLSRKRLAAHLGVDESTVKRWEDGKGRPLVRLRQVPEPLSSPFGNAHGLFLDLRRGRLRRIVLDDPHS